MKICTFEGCDKKHHARGLCSSHRRQSDAGKPLTRLRDMGNGKSFQDRFWAKIQRTETCWDWTGAINSRGYGVIKKNDNILLAHRYSYQEHKGKIPTGISIDHVCHNKRCVNPSHLRLATDKQNN